MYPYDAEIKQRGQETFMEEQGGSSNSQMEERSVWDVGKAQVYERSVGT